MSLLGRRLQLTNDVNTFVGQWSHIAVEGVYSPNTDYLIDGITPYTIPICESTNEPIALLTSDGVGTLTATRDCIGDAFFSCFYDVSGSTDVYVGIYINNALQIQLRVSSATSGDSFVLTKRLSLNAGDTISVRSNNVGAPTGNCNIRQETTRFLFRVY